jgi:hypothetical protein
MDNWIYIGIGAVIIFQLQAILSQLHSQTLAIRETNKSNYTNQDIAIEPPRPEVFVPFEDRDHVKNLILELELSGILDKHAEAVAEAVADSIESKIDMLIASDLSVIKDNTNKLRHIDIDLKEIVEKCEQIRSNTY